MMSTDTPNLGRVVIQLLVLVEFWVDTFRVHQTYDIIDYVNIASIGERRLILEI